MSWSILNVCVVIAAMALACQPSHEHQLEEDNVMSQNLKPNPKPTMAPTPPLGDTKPRSLLRFPEALEGADTLPIVTGE